MSNVAIIANFFAKCKLPAGGSRGRQTAGFLIHHVDTFCCS
ncbi:hypothetical protein SUBVAR_05577 [Subdoligranulum variabile DSM 15176]|uniref:Uncharacterized protein n=1 Tax=Subdoligranulum variabile DSM 15176 TaxID=411471 RepID=D1PML5_9FIRM|nr:hypothetical protein SUBVAR_05577 [Subdoligranulum variabile DSM 15176]